MKIHPYFYKCWLYRLNVLRSKIFDSKCILSASNIYQFLNPSLTIPACLSHKSPFALLHTYFTPSIVAHYENSGKNQAATTESWFIYCMKNIILLFSWDYSWLLSLYFVPSIFFLTSWLSARLYSLVNHLLFMIIRLDLV